MAFKRVEKQTVIICKQSIPQRTCRWPCVTASQVRGMRSKCSLENLHVCVSAQILIKGVWIQTLLNLPSAVNQIENQVTAPFLFLLMNRLESWQQEARNSSTVTFRCHFIEIIFILIYRKLSSALQECHFKVPFIQLHPLLTSSENAQRSAYWYSCFFFFFLRWQPPHHLWKMTVSYTTSAALPGSPANDSDPL